MCKLEEYPEVQYLARCGFGIWPWKIACFLLGKTESSKDFGDGRQSLFLVL